MYTSEIWITESCNENSLLRKSLFPGTSKLIEAQVLLEDVSDDSTRLEEHSQDLIAAHNRNSFQDEIFPIHLNRGKRI